MRGNFRQSFNSLGCFSFVLFRDEIGSNCNNNNKNNNNNKIMKIRQIRQILIIILHYIIHHASFYGNDKYIVFTI